MVVCVFMFTFVYNLKTYIMNLYKSILDRANNPTKEENKRVMMLLKKNADKKKAKNLK